jgi:peptidoglycan/LPS O-acetylase OafA/YrhL
MSSSFGVYLVGFVVIVTGLAYGAHLAHVPTPWIAVGVIVLVGLGILKAVTHTTTKTPPKS